MVFSDAKDDGIDLPRFPDKEKEDEVDDAGEEARQHGHPVCFSFQDHDWSDQRSDIEIPEFEKKVHPANILSVSRILSKTLFQFVSGLQNAKQHWSEDWILDVTALAKVMTRKRFLDLLYSIHINDNSKMTAAGSDQFNKLYKTGHFLTT